jgi:N-acetylmuramoyl-L-alanine amidase
MTKTMTRKLISILLCAFALLLLMGAGVEPQQQTVSMLAEEESASPQRLTLDAFEAEVQALIEEENQEAQAATAEAQLIEVAPAETAVVEPTPTEAVPAETAPAETALVETTAAEENLDSSLLIDGAYAPADLGKLQKDGVTYVSLAAMSKALDGTAQVSWDAASNTVVVTTERLKITAKVGRFYLEANGRYLYLPNTVQMVDGRVTVPLWAVAKAFDATVGWDGATGTVTVTRGSGAIQSGDSFYSSESLFWLSRLIYAESSGEPLKGMIAVGNVVMNRVASPIFPNSIQGVLAQKNQFSTYKNGNLANRTPSESCVIAAKLVLDGAVVDETSGALYFDSTPKSWASRNKTCIATIGGHKFYR